MMNTSEYKDKKGRFVMIIGKMEGTLMSLFSMYVLPGSDWSIFINIYLD